MGMAQKKDVRLRRDRVLPVLFNSYEMATIQRVVDQHGVSMAGAVRMMMRVGATVYDPGYTPADPEE